MKLIIMLLALVCHVAPFKKLILACQLGVNIDSWRMFAKLLALLANTNNTARHSFTVPDRYLVKTAARQSNTRLTCHVIRPLVQNPLHCFASHRLISCQLKRGRLTEANARCRAISLSDSGLENNPHRDLSGCL